MSYQDKPPIDELMHYGTPRHSGRYPWGSGEDPHQRTGDFISRVNDMKAKGISESNIAKELGIVNEQGKPSTGRLRAQISVANEVRRRHEYETARSLREDGLSLQKIAEKMGYKNDSSVRSLLNEDAANRMNQARKTADFLKKQVDEKGMIDIGAGVERELGISKEKLNQAVYMLEMEGYVQYGGGVPQITNQGKQTILKVLCPPGTEHKEIYNLEKINSITDYKSYDGGDTFKPSFVFPESMSSKRLAIRYAEDGGIHKDGVIELRRGVPDLDLGESHYAQVRIMVDGNRYLKGMAVYGDNMPDGVDVIFNTNKTKDVSKLDVLKKCKTDADGNIDQDNPFGSLIKEKGGQSYYIDKDGKERLSLINKRAEEGDWNEWSKDLPSQFLSKQNITLIKKQLGFAMQDKQNEFDEIMAIPNPTVRKALLKSFSDDCDAASVHLKAAALPRQRYQVLLPLTTIKDNEVYAPNFENGEKIALIRYPHGGTFEIPVLTVNNKIPEGKRVIGTNAKDAFGISSKVAERLSGADFDGDTAMGIPTSGNGKNTKVNITSTDPLSGLEGFDPKMSYGHAKVSETKIDGKTVKRYYDANGNEFKAMNNTQTEMGKISNLITDMTIKGATTSELAKAVRHSMVVIDAEKHGLDYKKSEIDNNIASLKKKYQGEYNADGKLTTGASTLISRAKSQDYVLKRKGSPQVNQKGKPWYDPDRPEGALVYKHVKEEYVDKKGKTVTRMDKVTKMEKTDDARTLSSGTPKEEAYAEYANGLKNLANQARLAMVNSGKIAYSASAKRTYQAEVDSLNAKLSESLKNAPKERKAQILANSIVNAKKQANPDMTNAEIKKAGQKALVQAREKVGAKRTTIELTDNEWKAIQAGAISENLLTKIINHTDTDSLRSKATPRATVTVSDAQIARIKAMAKSGYTNDEIARALGKSASTVSKYINK